MRGFDPTVPLPLLTPKELASCLRRSLTWVYGAKRAMRKQGIHWLDQKYPIEAFLAWIKKNSYRVSDVYVQKRER